MKAISLYQPWATLCLLEDPIFRKHNETRSFASSHRGPLVIHAAKKMPPEALELAKTRPFWSALALDPFWSQRRGMALCVVNMTGCDRMTDAATIEQLAPMTSNERAFGRYEIGRHAWRFTDAQVFVEPFPAIGRQGFFEVRDFQVLYALASYGAKIPDWLDDYQFTLTVEEAQVLAKEFKRSEMEAT